MTYLQGFIIQLIVYGLIWIWNPYLGFLLSIVLFAIFLGIFIVAFISEKIEPTKVPRSYFTWMIISMMPPLVVLLFFIAINEGDLYWLN